MKKIKTYAGQVSQNKILIIVFILIAICGQIFKALPYNIFENMLDTKFAFSLSEVQTVMQELGPEGRFTYIISTFTLDIIFPILLVTFALGFFAKFKFKSDFIYLLPFMGAGFDLLQNIQTSLIMNTEINEITSVQVILASYTNQAKFIFYYISFALIIFGFLKKFIISKFSA
tara:strand:- start:469 stop:987 length:519 start_codon:yes stop_codon:yes gene_type:complete